MTFPSIGTFSPGLTITMFPFNTSFISTFSWTILPSMFLSIVASVAFSSTKLLIESDVLDFALSSRYLPNIRNAPNIILVSYNMNSEEPKRLNVLNKLAINDTPIPSEYITSMFKLRFFTALNPDLKIGYDT